MKIYDTSKECNGHKNDKGKQTMKDCKKMCLGDNNCKFIDFVLYTNYLGESDKCETKNNIKKCQCILIHHDCKNTKYNSKYAVYKKQPK